MVKDNIDLATVHRILNTFKEKGIVFCESYHGSNYYYIAKTFHHHIVCRKCGPTRIGYKIEKETKNRVCRKCGEQL